jgi:putative hemolysin
VIFLLPALLAALFATVSTSMSALSGARRAALRETLRPSGSSALDRYIDSPERIEARWLWLRVIGISATAVLVSQSLELPGVPKWVLGVLASIIVYAIPAEMLRPSAVAHASEWGPSLLRWLSPLEYLIAPLSDPLHFLAKKLASDKKVLLNAEVAETEVEMIVNEGEQTGAFSADASAMIRNVLEFGDVTAKDVMVPRIHVEALDAALTCDEALAQILESQHSRYPVFADSVDNIVGILHVKDLYARVLGRQPRTAKIVDVARRPVAFVPETQAATVVLKDMRAGRHHLAIVVDEFGGFAGIVTLEDLLEEIVGDIRDEHDEEGDQEVKNLSSGALLVNASLPVSDVNRRLNAALPEGDYVSLGGMLVDHLGGIPPTGSVHELFGLRLTIREADPRHIAWVEVEQLPASPESGVEGKAPASSSRTGT